MPAGVVNIVLVHSGKERAKQTAEHMRDVLVPAGCTLIGDATDGDALAPNADTAVAIQLMDGLITPASTLLVLVGHLPHLHKLAVALGVEAAAEQFTPAGGLLLEGTGAAWVRAAIADQSRWFEV